MTLFFRSHQIQIYRRRRSGNSNRWSMSATLTVYNADIQPSGVERTQMAEGRFGQVFDAFVDATIDIKEGDQLVANGVKYSVKGVTKWDGAGLLSHKELLIVSQDGNDG